MFTPPWLSLVTYVIIYVLQTIKISPLLPRHHPGVSASLPINPHPRLRPSAPLVLSLLLLSAYGITELWDKAFTWCDGCEAFLVRQTCCLFVAFLLLCFRVTLAVLDLALETRMASDSENPPAPGIDGVCHHHHPACLFLFTPCFCVPFFCLLVYG